MIIGLAKLLSVAISGMAKKIGASALDKFSERQVGKRANTGQDLTREGTFKELVKKELQKLAAQPDTLLEGLRDSNISTWIQKEEFLDPFIWVLIAKGDGQANDSGPAHRFLAQQYSKETGEIEQLAAGPISIIANHVLGKLQSSPRRKTNFQLALGRLQSAEFQTYFKPELRSKPSAFDIFRLQGLAQSLIDAGRNTWGMPELLAPFSLETQKVGKDKESTPISPAQIVAYIQPKARIVISGDGGSGKTTFLLQLASQLLASTHSRVPIYVDAAAWAESKLPILDFVANLPSAHLQNLSANNLTWFAKGAQIVLMVNGWNEIPAKEQSNCKQLLNSLITATEDMPVVIVSRAYNDAGSLNSPLQIAVRGITSAGQREIIQKELGTDNASALFSKLENDIRLQQVARSPLILRGLIAQAKKGLTTSSAVFDLLEAVVTDLEESSVRQSILAAPPISRLQKHYLEELACTFNNKRSLRLTYEEALSALGTAAKNVAHMQGAGVAPPDVLEVLRNHHVVHVQDNVVRFAHQRFQEYFSASRIKRICERDVEATDLLNHVVNEPFWVDALGLVAEKLKTSQEAMHRQKLVQAAMTVDLPYACDLAGICSMTRTDAPVLYQEIISQINELSASDLQQVRELAVACKIASRFPEFAGDLWALFESDDVYRLNYYRVNGTPVSVQQLGVNALHRINSWDAERQVEFMHEISNNPDNYRFLLEVANTFPEIHVRKAAIQALLWSYPSSIAAVNAWIDAPFVAQLDPTILSQIEYSLEQGIEADRIHEQLKAMERSGRLIEPSLLDLAIRFPDVISEVPLAPLFEELSRFDINTDHKKFVGIARNHAPERLKELAMELAIYREHSPEWIREVLLELPVQSQEEVFNRTWKLIEDGKNKLRWRPEDIGPLATTEQIENSVLTWLVYASLPPESHTEEGNNRQRGIQYLLAYAEGNKLFDIVVEHGKAADYETSTKLVNLVWDRISPFENRISLKLDWKPTTTQLEKLLQTFSDKKEESELPQVKLFILMACIVAEVAATANTTTLLAALDKYLIASSKYKAAIEAWRKKPRSSSRPSAPSARNLVTALTRWGFDAIPEMLKRAKETGASDIVPPVLSKVTNQPWLEIRQSVRATLSNDIAEGTERHKLGLRMTQPSPEYQEVTDQAAEGLGALLDEEVKRYLHRRIEDPKFSPHNIGNVHQFAVHLAEIPSPITVAPVVRALSSGLLPLWGFIDSTRGLLHHGWSLSDKMVIQALETMYQIESQKPGIHDDLALAQLCQLALSVETVDLLTNSPEHYLTHWRQYASPNDIFRLIGESNTGYAWNLLLKAKEFFGAAVVSDNFGRALSMAFSLAHVDSLIAIIEDGRLLNISRVSSRQSGIARNIARVVSAHPEQAKKILAALRAKENNDADRLAFEILNGLDAAEESFIEFGLAAADAGRADSQNSPAYKALMNLLLLKIPLSEIQYEVRPKACNALRIELLKRASHEVPAQMAARKILASLECYRREGGRPSDEPRNPLLIRGASWTDSLVSSKI